MRFKNILVYLDQGESNEERVGSALAIAKAHDATLTGVVVDALPSSGILQKLGVSGNDAVVEKARADAQSTIDEFRKRAETAGIATETSIIECDEGKASEKLSRLARVHDLSILRQANPDRDHAAFVAVLSEQVMFSSGRPVIFMPYVGAKRVPFSNGLIAWDGSRAATRAVHDSLPLLETMEEALILVVDPENIEHYQKTKPGEKLSRHLTAHGISNTVKRVPRGDISTSSVIMNELANTGADLLIMGAYGTPKLREVILGGVTRTVLESMIVPVFMSH
ncbi:universal stress protein [Pelagibius sp.]|uniref:universal stress protein n=1 Tax=Pelagibius sp. TaxID=1931238 RepID=UPI003BAE2B36